MTKKVFFSRTWLMAGSILFLSTACQPKTPVSSEEQQSPKAGNYAAPSKDAGCNKGSSCQPCDQACPKKECPCPTECAKECPKKEIPPPEACPKKECPCPTECPKKECPCPDECSKDECSDNVEVKSNVEQSVTQSPVRSEASVETSSPAVSTETAAS